MSHCSFFIISRITMFFSLINFLFYNKGETESKYDRGHFKHFWQSVWISCINKFFFLCSALTLSQSFLALYYKMLVHKCNFYVCYTHQNLIDASFFYRLSCARNFSHFTIISKSSGDEVRCHSSGFWKTFFKF